MTELKIPDWYLEDISDPAACRKMRTGAAVRRALGEFGAALAREVTEPPCKGSWLGRIEPRAKTAGLFLLIFVATLVHSLSALGALIVLILAVYLSIGVPLRSLGRVWLGVPLFSLAIILPATTNFVTPGQPVWDIFSIARETRIWVWTIPQTISITDAGLVVAGRFLLRTLGCVSLSYLLIVTTDPAQILVALRRMGMPKVFGMVLSMSQRYISVMLRMAQEIHLAKLSRTICVRHSRGERLWVAAGVGMLLRRTYAMAEEVQSAMIARGYDGDLKLGRYPSIQFRDFVWLAAAISAGAALMGIDRWAAGVLR